MAVHRLHFKATVYFYPLLFVLMMWGGYWLEMHYSYDLLDWGIQPRSLIGLRGIIFSPLLHGSLSHLASNTLPIFLLSMALFYFYQDAAWQVLIFGGILTGLMTWCIAPEGTTHIGASGIAYLLFSFLFFVGFWSKNYRLVAVSLVIAFVYGSLIWGVFPGDSGISWQGHLSGFSIGLLFSFFFRNYQIVMEEGGKTLPKSSRHEEEFLRHFDADGNFVPASEWRQRAEEVQKNKGFELEGRLHSEEEEE